jgi:GT2 family glycosyltransferase
VTRKAGDVIIATKDRPDELARCLRSIEAQTLRPETVRIVDASSDDATVTVARSFLGSLPIVLTRSSPSTTRQRNRGVDDSRADLVHFLDDDVELDPGYLAAIVEVFATDPDGEIAGVGGLPTNLPTFAPSRLQRLVAPDSARQGAVLASGRGVLVYRTAVPLEVDWLSGCCMSFRRRLVAEARFDDRFDGYVIGEDLELSYRLRQHHRLVVTPHARLVHHESPRNRMDLMSWAERDVRARRRRVESGVGRFRRSSFFADVAMQLTLHGVRSLRPGPVATRERALTRGIARGLLPASREN